ncbi:MAG: ABC transporter ATP-binding protein [Micrococcales bacterium]|nr:ABC transporter ATP-binding protein [Micrococcales bacterium]
MLDGIDLQVGIGQSVAIMGRSGSGKSTLLNVLLGLRRPDSGQVLVGGVDMSQASERAWTTVRREQLGVVFQSSSLLPDLTPVENVMVPLLISGQPAEDVEGAARALLEEFGVPGDVGRTADLSGGEQQRVALARALTRKPRLVLADEPTASLDWTTRDSAAESLFAVPKRVRCGLVVVTHDPDVARRADRCLMLTNGQLSDAEVAPPVGHAQ